MPKGLKDLKLSDILYSIIIPVVIGLLIIWFPLNQETLANIYPDFQGIFVFGLQEVIMIVAVPMILGLLWNKWAGGASGFILGSIYALWYSMYGIGTIGWVNNISLLGYLVSAMIIGYMAGALNKKSTSLSRLLFSGLVSGLVGGLFLFFVHSLSPFQYVVGGFGLFITITPRLIFGAVIPLIAKVIIRHSEKNKGVTEHP